MPPHHPVSGRRDGLNGQRPGPGADRPSGRDPAGRRPTTSALPLRDTPSATGNAPAHPTPASPSPHQDFGSGPPAASATNLGVHPSPRACHQHPNAAAPGGFAAIARPPRRSSRRKSTSRKRTAGPSTGQLDPNEPWRAASPRPARFRPDTTRRKQSAPPGRKPMGRCTWEPGSLDSFEKPGRIRPV
jgi:hypothetical protein